MTTSVASEKCLFIQVCCYRTNCSKISAHWGRGFRFYIIVFKCFQNLLVVVWKASRWN